MQWETRQKNLLLILARDLASRLATPMFVVDAVGTLVFYNEAAEQVLGQTFSDVGELPAEEWIAAFSPVTHTGDPIPFRELPLGVALFEGKPTHREFSIRGADGVERALGVTAIPLLAHREEIVGGVALFWDKDADPPSSVPGIS